LMPMKTIVLLIGTNEAGKTKTLKKFFGVSLIMRLRPLQLLNKVINGTTVFGVSLSSPQEQSKFCNVNEVETRLTKRIQKCEDTSGGKDYAIIIPFGVYQKSRKSKLLNEKCILEPMEWLKGLGFKVVALYLRKESARLLDDKSSLVRKIAKFEILSNKEYERQAKEIEALLVKLLK